MVNTDEVHTPQSTLLTLLRNQETYLASERVDKLSDCDTSTRISLAQESDEEILFLEACFQAQGIKGPQAKSN